MVHKARISLTDRQTERKTDRYNIVSLGFFCSVAMELERCGIRSVSLPFDWLITGNYEAVLKLIANRFDRFLDMNNLYQEYDINPAYYYNDVYDLHFYHDFNPHLTLEEQYNSVRQKYDRRINRFYEIIKEPTVFIRYCSDEEELEFICNNSEKISHFLKSLNPKNEIIYISSKKVASGLAGFNYYVEPDRGDAVSRKFLMHMPELKEYLIEKSGISNEELRRNIKRYICKQVKKVFRRGWSKVRKITVDSKKSCYRHDKQYGDIL